MQCTNTMLAMISMVLQNDRVGKDPLNWGSGGSHASVTQSMPMHDEFQAVTGILSRSATKMASEENRVSACCQGALGTRTRWGGHGHALNE